MPERSVLCPIVVASVIEKTPDQSGLVFAPCIMPPIPNEQAQCRIDRLLHTAESAADEEGWITDRGRAVSVLAVDPGEEDVMEKRYEFE